MAAAARQIGDWLDHIGRVHFRSIDLTLDRVRRVGHALRLPAAMHSVTVAGTNGKGSSVAYLESIYRAAGYRTGAYTSPHLVRYNERVRIDGCPVEDGVLEAAFNAVETARGGVPLTYFEFGTLAALWIFRETSPDVAILEVGMGGRLDAVNMVDADIALVTEIGLDHQQWLGESVEKIAREKAGVLRYRGAAVSSGVRPPAALAAAADAKRCDLWQLGIHFGYELHADYWDWLPLSARSEPVRKATGLPLPVGGTHQVNNAAGAIAVVRRLDPRLPVPDRALEEGIGNCRLPGRLQRVGRDPEIWLDVCHNADGLSVLASRLRTERPGGRQFAVFSMLADKDLAGAVRHVDDLFDQWFLAPIANERAADVSTLRAVVSNATTVPVNLFGSVEEAADRAIALAGDGDRVVVFGSFYAVGDIMRHLHFEPYTASG
ncbi:MAG: bifunctional tetrahydrofolate synthase/dihydrofolate synthase [Proteobacteria bacterium]|nr:MAG: bifunctional tetrahydrofolate synthase/dihydrofolate synthase [Pseudomonadota bacterium]